MTRSKVRRKPCAIFLALLTITSALLVTLPLTYFILNDLLSFEWLTKVVQPKQYLMLQNNAIRINSTTYTEPLPTTTSTEVIKSKIKVLDIFDASIISSTFPSKKPSTSTNIDRRINDQFTALTDQSLLTTSQLHRISHNKTDIIHDQAQTKTANSKTTSRMSSTFSSVTQATTTSSSISAHNTGSANNLNILTTTSSTTTAIDITTVNNNTFVINDNQQLKNKGKSVYLDRLMHNFLRNKAFTITTSLPKHKNNIQMYNNSSDNNNNANGIRKNVQIINNSSNLEQNTLWNIKKPLTYTLLTSTTVAPPTIKLAPTALSVTTKTILHNGAAHKNQLLKQSLSSADDRFFTSSTSLPVNTETMDTKNVMTNWKSSTKARKQLTTNTARTMSPPLSSVALTTTSTTTALRFSSTQRPQFGNKQSSEYNHQQTFDDSLNMNVPQRTSTNIATKNLYQNTPFRHRQHQNSFTLRKPSHNSFNTLEPSTVPVYITTSVPSQRQTIHATLHHQKHHQHRHEQTKHDQHATSDDAYENDYGYELRTNYIQHGEHDQYDLSSAVVVTALFDIGRGDWYKYTRSYEQYLEYLNKLLRLKNCLVIFTDHEGAAYVRPRRHQRNTQVFEMTLRQLPLYRYREEMQQIIDSEQNNWIYDHAMKDHPESKSVDYDIVVNSKAFFVYNATKSSKFRHNSKYFTWIDAGYGHADQSVVPAHCHWKPALPNGFITVIKITPDYDKIERYSINDLYRVDWSVISGGFFGGDAATIDRFYKFYHKTFLDLLDERKVDDDQTTLTITMKNYPNLFYTLHSNGDWFALFKFFPC